MIATILRVLALRPLLSLAILGIPVILLIAVGLFTIMALKVLIFVVLPIVVVVWAAKKFFGPPKTD
jgi:hypothetical protein